MKTTSLVLALFLSTTQGVKMHSRIYSGHRNARLQAWDEISKNVNVNELLQSEENALNEQVAGKNLKYNESEQNSYSVIDRNSAADIISSGPKERRQKTLSLMQASDPTLGDIPDNSEKSNVIANILGSPSDKKSQSKMIEAITDNDAIKGHTKSPGIPIPQVHVTDVESKPDPIVIDPDHETDEAPDTTKTPVEIGPNAFAQRVSMSTELMAEVNKNQGQGLVQNENQQFLAIKQAHSQKIVEKVSNMNKEMDEFSHTLDMSHYNAAMQLQQELKKDGLRDHEKLMSVTTKELFKKGFKSFPQIAKNEYVEEQLQYLEAAEDNLNGNMINPRLVEALVQRGNEVAANLEKAYGEQWENPLK